MTCYLFSLSLALAPQPCLQYWPEPGLQQFGPMTVELLSRTADDDVIIRLFRVQNITRVGGSKKNSFKKPDQIFHFHTLLDKITGAPVKIYCNPNKALE